MKTLYLTACAFTFSVTVSAQCISVSCNSNITTNNDSGFCGAVVNYTTPIVTNYSCVGTATDTFYFTGAMQTFTVPAGVTVMNIQTWGAQGGANWVNNNNFGGYVSGDISVTPGSTLNIFVGGQATTTVGGFNGGGNGEGAGKGGGGGTDVRIGGTTYNDRVICAGGGGGAGYWSSLHVVGGQGGGLTGGDGYRDPSFAANPGGKGATQTAGGADGTCVSFNVPACAGGFGYGGSITGCGCEVYGGGGGWYGGAASGNCRGGGGGSGYVIPTATNVVMNTGVRAGNGMVVITYNAGPPPVVQTSGLASGSLFPVGTTTNTFIATDGVNSDTCTFTVTVSDTEAPVITNVPANIVQGTDPNMCNAVVTWTSPSILDNCSVNSSSNYSSGATFPTGTTTVTYIATDSAGNADTASFTVTITDTEPPVLSCPSGVTVSADSGMCSASNVSLGALTVIDNCGATVTNDAPAVYPVGVTVVNYTAVDSGGNSVSCTQTVTVVDSEAPVLSACPQDVTMCEGVIQFSSPTVTDNCGATVSQVSGPAAGSVLTAGNYSVVFAASDTSGNSDSCSFTITVHAYPTVTVNNPNTVCVDDGNLTLNGTPAGGTWSGTAVTGNTFSPSTAGTGQQVLMYNVVDTNGCSTSVFDTILVSQCVGINESGVTTFNMFPNPATSGFTFNTNVHGTMEMFGANGQLVMSKSITADHTEINTSELAGGTYLVRFTTTTGSVSSGQLQIVR